MKNLEKKEPQKPNIGVVLGRDGPASLDLEGSEETKAVRMGGLGGDPGVDGTGLVGGTSRRGSHARSSRCRGREVRGLEVECLEEFSELSDGGSRRSTALADDDFSSVIAELQVVLGLVLGVRTTSAEIVG